MFLEISMPIHSVAFALKINCVYKLISKKYAKTTNLLCAGDKVFVTYQTLGA